jgi:predicted DNA-binding transcriptional regulator AlpA
LSLIPISRATLFRLMAKNAFPRGRFISSNRRLWLASEIARWQQAVDERDPHRHRGVGHGRRKTTS